MENLNEKDQKKLKERQWLYKLLMRNMENKVWRFRPMDSNTSNGTETS